jgi:hypothetical protein
MYSFSTCWNSNRRMDGRAMLREIRDPGFEYAELKDSKLTLRRRAFA